MPLLRKIIFYLFCALYLTIAPLLIIRMSGFVFNAHSHKMVKTGLIYISTNPPDAQVLIDGKPAHELAPTIIRDLFPGNHTIRLKLDGYQNWENEIPVVAKKATILENILLIPNNWKIDELSTFAFDRITPLPDNLYLLAANSDAVKDLYILKLNKDWDEQRSDEENQISNLPQSLFPEEFIYKDAQILRYFTVEKSPFFIVHILEGDKHKFLWIDPRDKQVRIEDITDLLPEEPQRLFWEPNDDKNIFAQSGSAISRINIKTKAIYPKILDGVRTATVFENNIYVLTEELRIIRCDYEGKNKKAWEVALPQSISPLDNAKIYVINDHLLVLNSDQGLILIDSSIHILTTSTLSGFSLDTEHSLMLVWTNRTIGMIDYSKDNLENKSQLQIFPLYQDGQNIQQALWANNGNNIIVRDGSKILLLDRESFGDPRVTAVLHVKKDSPIYFTERGGKLYYIDATTHLLSAIQIVHHKPLIPAHISDRLKLSTLE